MRRLGAFALAPVLLALVACGGGGPAVRPNTSVFVQEVPGRDPVTCIWASGVKKGGLSCDWEGGQ